MLLDETLIDVLAAALSNITGKAGDVRILEAVSGGSINRCYRLRFNSETYFLKLNAASVFPRMFMAEASALSRIAETGTIESPKVLATGEAGTDQFLLLQWIEKGANTEQAQANLGQNLAALHRVSNATFGLDHDNYMGALKQGNGFYVSFPDFFIEKRLSAQVELAFSNTLLGKAELGGFEQLYQKFASLIPFEPPALVHGDLWAGNYMIGTDHIPYIVDPAIAWSHREVDIAMTRLFGGFDEPFYNAYRECYPLEKGWERRISLWNLYPLLIHLNLFGQGYLGDVKRALKNWL